MTAVTIAGQVAAMAGTPAGQAPGEAMGVFAREQAELAAGGIPDEVIASGALLPDADLFDPLGAPGMLQDAIGDQPAVVVLYRGAWCPCCTITVRTYQSELPPMQAWIRAQPPAKIGATLHERFARSYEEGSLITPGQSARSLMGHLASGATGEIWNVNTSRPEE